MNGDRDKRQQRCRIKKVTPIKIFAPRKVNAPGIQTGSEWATKRSTAAGINLSETKRAALAMKGRQLRNGGNTMAGGSQKCNRENKSSSSRCLDWQRYDSGRDLSDLGPPRTFPFSESSTTVETGVALENGPAEPTNDVHQKGLHPPSASKSIGRTSNSDDGSRRAMIDISCTLDKRLRVSTIAASARVTGTVRRSEI